MASSSLLQQFHRWRLGMLEPLPLVLPNRAVINKRYQILCQLGRGEVERTYLAEDWHHKNRWCVLKEIVPRLLNPRMLAEGRRRFEQEVSLLRDLEHPQLPAFGEMLECEFAGLHRWIVVQEWLEGMSYLDLVKSRPYREEEVLRFLQEVFPALHYLHQQDPPVIHGNLSPETILHSSEMDKPILINFGTFKHIAAQIADPFGDPVSPRLRLYRPPEQFRGHLSPSTDLYALAVTVLTLLTGCPDPREFYDAKRREWRWAKHVAVSVGFVVVLDRMLQADPNLRYPSVADVQEALAAIHSRRPVPVPEAVVLLSSPTQSLGSASLGSTSLGTTATAPYLLPPAPTLTTLNATLATGFTTTLTTTAQQLQGTIHQGGTWVAAGLQRSGVGVRSQLLKLKQIPPDKALNGLLGLLFWGSILGFLGLSGYAGLRLVHRLKQDPAIQAVTAAPAVIRSTYLPDGDLESCHTNLAQRYLNLSQPSWTEVDQRFAAAFPGFPGPIEARNPDHAFYLQEWCFLANQWLEDQGN